MSTRYSVMPHKERRNKGKLFGRKPQLEPGENRVIRIRLELEGFVRDLGLFTLASHSTL